MTLLELKYAFKDLEARVASLEGRLASAEKSNVARQVVETPKPLKAKMCPHCNEVPAYFFHTKNCRANKNKNDGRKEKTP